MSDEEKGIFWLEVPGFMEGAQKGAEGRTFRHASSDYLIPVGGFPNKIYGQTGAQQQRGEKKQIISLKTQKRKIEHRGSPRLKPEKSAQKRGGDLRDRVGNF